MTAGRTISSLLGALILLAGCRTAEEFRDPEYAHVAYHADQASHAPSASAETLGSVMPQLEGPQEVDVYIRYALEQNPEIQAARKRVEAAAYQVPVAASLPDPMLGMTFFPAPVQTAAGEQEFSFAVNQKIPWRGKLSTRSAMAESQTNVARAELAAVELDIIEKVKHAYFELYFIQQSIAVTQAEQRLLEDIRAVADARYRTNQTSQQDVLRAELELSNVENELIQLRQRFRSGQARLARLLHVSSRTNLMAQDQLPPEQAPRDLERLQSQAVAARPELHAQLAALQRDRQAVELSKLDYLPDVTLGATWIDVANRGLSPVANGDDSFLISAGINLPLYRQRLEASQNSAEAKAVSAARHYDALRDGTLEEVTSLFEQAASQAELLRLFEEEILPKARQTLEVAQRGYSSGEVDFLQLVDNWRQLLRYEVNFLRLEASLRQSLARLERVVGGGGGGSDASAIWASPDSVPLPGPATDRE